MTTTTLSGSITADAKEVQVAAAGTIAAGQVFRMGDERGKIVGIVGTLVTLARGWFGTRAVAHTTGENFTYGTAAEFAALQVGDVKTPPLPYFYAAAGAIAVKAGRHILKAGSAAAMTLAAPSAAEDGLEMDIFAEDAYAYTVTCSTGFNAGGASADVATWGAAVGNGMHLIAHGGKWKAVNLTGVTLG